MSVQLPLFPGLACPAGVQLLDSVSSRCPAVQYLQDLLVQQMSSCWTVCPAVQHLHDLGVQQMSNCYLQDLVVQQVPSCWTVCPAVQYLQDLLVQQLSSCWTVCPAIHYFTRPGCPADVQLLFAGYSLCVELVRSSMAELMILRLQCKTFI